MQSGNQNALTHGAFTEAVLLPSEDPKEFETLHAALVVEWNPEGPTEEDKVLSIAIGRWRKRRFRRFFQRRAAELVEEEKTRKMRIEMLVEKQKKVVASLELVADATEENLADKLGQGFADKFKEQFPRENYDDDKSWFAAIANHMCETMESRLTNERKSVPCDEGLYDEDFALREQQFEERVDAKIDRDVKQLGQIKTMKAIGIGRRSGPVTIGPLKQIQSLPIQVAESDENKT